VVGAPERDYSQVGKLDFMNLLVAQIKHQDPLSPMDNTEFTSQITQFTMLEEIQTLATKLDDNILVGQSINNTAMLNLVGRHVSVEGNHTWVEDEEASESFVTVGKSATATIEVVDAHGDVVDTYQRDLVKGRNDITWDAVLPDDEAAPDGEYTLRVEVEKDGASVPFVTLMTGPVTGLHYEDNLAVIEVGGEEFYVSEIYRIS
jgi:flagellar basal-body rod modification protein FlgD